MLWLSQYASGRTEIEGGQASFIFIYFLVLSLLGSVKLHLQTEYENI